MPENNGFLTRTDKEFLRGEKEYEQKNSRYARRRSIRQGTRTAFGDLALLYHTLSDDELEKIFEPNDISEETSLSEADLERQPAAYFPTALALLLRATNSGEHPEIYSGLGAEQPAFADFARAVTRGIETYLASEHELAADVSVDISIEDTRPADDILEEYQTDDGDTPDLSTLATLELAGVEADELRGLASDTDS